MKRIGGCAAVLVLAAVAMSRPAVPGQGTADALTVRLGGVLRVRALVSPFDPVLDPVSSAHAFVLEQLYDGLVRFDSNYNIIPAIAEYWKISDDGRRAVFFLRKGVKFHNGRELNADDVKFSLERVIRNTSSGRLYPYFAGKVVGAEEFVSGETAEISGLRVVDPYTFEIQWTKPYVSSLYLLAMSYCKILPKDLVISEGRGFFQKPVGTGPFRFSSWLRSPRLDILGVRLERNQFYFGKKAYIDGIDYSPNFSDNQVDEGLVHILPVNSGRQLEGSFNILTNNSLRTLYLAFSCDIPPLDRPAVRRAIALGINKNRLAEVLSSPGSELDVMDDFIPPILPGFYPRDIPAPYAPEWARLFLARIMQERGQDRLPLDLVIVGPRTDFGAAFAKELQNELRPLGVDLTVRNIKKADEAGRLTGPYLMLVDFTLDFPDPEDVVQPLFNSKSAVNLSRCRYADGRVDSLLAHAEVEPSWDKRLRIFREIEAILGRDLPAVPLFSEKIRLAVLPKVHGLKATAMGATMLDTREVWIAR